MAKKKKKKLYDETLDLDVGIEWIRARRLEKKIEAGDEEAKKEYDRLTQEFEEGELISMTPEDE
jgi:hypothetical protein